MKKNKGPNVHEAISTQLRGAKEQLLRRNVKRFRGGLLFKAHRRFYHSTLGLRVIQRKKTRKTKTDLPHM